MATPSDTTTLRTRRTGVNQPALLHDPLAADVEHGAEAAHGITQPLLFQPPPRRYAQEDFAPQPGHADLIVVVAELAPQHRLPDNAPGGIAHVRLHPLRGGYALEFAPVAGFLQHKRPQSQPDAVDEAQRRKAEQVHRRGEVPDATAVIQAHPRFQPLQRVAQAQFFNQLHHVGVADEQMVVAALQLATAYREG